MTTTGVDSITDIIMAIWSICRDRRMLRVMRTATHHNKNAAIERVRSTAEQAGIIWLQTLSCWHGRVTGIL